MLKVHFYITNNLKIHYAAINYYLHSFADAETKSTHHRRAMNNLF